MVNCFVQLKVLFIKQFWLAKESPGLSICRYLAPAIIVLLCLFIQLFGDTASDELDIVFEAKGTFQRCTDEPCITTLYTWVDNFEELVKPFDTNQCDSLPADSEDNLFCNLLYTDLQKQNRIDASKRVMQQFASNSELTTGNFSNSVASPDVQYVPTYLEMREFVLKNPGRVYSMIVFAGSVAEQAALAATPNLGNQAQVSQTLQEAGVPISYASYLNSSTASSQDILEFKTALDKAILTVEARDSDMFTDSIDVSLGFQVGQYPGLASFDAVASFGPILFYCAILFNFTLILYAIVSEREARLRIALRMVGLSDAVYWLHQFLDALLTLIISTLLMLAVGYATRLRWFADSSFFAVFLVFFTFGLSMIPIAFVLAILISSSRAAFQAGMLIFVVGIIIQSIVTSPFLLNLIHQPALFEDQPKMVLGLQFYGPYNFAKMMNDVSSRSPQVPSDPDNTGLTWEAATEPRNLFCGPEGGDQLDSCIRYISLTDSALFQVYIFLIVSFLAWFLYNVHSNEAGQPVYFLCTPTFWRKLFGLKVPHKKNVGGVKVDQSAAADVIAEAKRAESADDIPLESVLDDPDALDASTDDDDDNDNNEKTLSKDRAVALRVVRLRKMYKSGLIKPRKFLAVKTMSLAVDQGQVLAVLGHNGCGKTTTISMMIGLIEATAGDTYVYGLSSKSDRSQVQSHIGVCFQHDILWEKLSAGQHVQLFATLKGIESSRVQEVIKKRLSDVGLYGVKDKAAGEFSGGMKRRLSVAIASVGNPKVVFLDEPTTGLDPVSRRQVWDSIRRLKKGRCVILTTHSMEEADNLSDRIAIMADGELKVIGTSLHLKNEYGAGYRINLTCKDEERVDELKAIAQRELPSAELIAESVAHLVYQLPNEHVEELVSFSKYLEKIHGKDTVLLDWALSQTTLEEVFMKISQHVESND